MKAKNKRVALICIITLAIVISLCVTAYALQSGNDADSPLSSEFEPVVFMKNETGLTDSISKISEVTNFFDYGYELKEPSDSELNSIKDSMINRENAVNIAVKEVECFAKSEAKSINAVVGVFTDPETISVSDAAKPLSDRLIWLVTFDDVTMERGGPVGDYDRSILADIHVVIDIETGEVLEIISQAA